MTNLINATEIILCGSSLKEWQDELSKRYGYVVVSEDKSDSKLQRIYYGYKTVNGERTTVGHFDLLQQVGVLYDRRSRNRPPKPQFMGIELDES